MAIVFIMGILSNIVVWHVGSRYLLCIHNMDLQYLIIIMGAGHIRMHNGTVGTSNIQLMKKRKKCSKPNKSMSQSQYLCQSLK